MRFHALLGLALFASSSAANPSDASACTAFVLADDAGAYVGKNLDWSLGTGAAVLRLRDPSSGVRYSNLTFTQFGTTRPLGGMNECGLVVEETSNRPTTGSDPGAVLGLDEFEWIGYVLDRSATVADALSTLETVSIRRRWIDIHYLLADRTGDVAVVDFVDGALRVHRGHSLPVSVLANDTYENSVSYLRRHRGFGGERVETDGPDSPERFVRAARAVHTPDAEPTTDRAFGILAEVAQSDTQWALVYDIARRSVHVRTRGLGSTIRTLDLLQLASADTTSVLDLNGDLEDASTSTWSPVTRAIEDGLRRTVAAAMDVAIPRTDSPARGEPIAEPRLEVAHVQNAGVLVRGSGRSVLVDALTDLTSEPSQPPRPFDHLSSDALRRLREGRSEAGCVDLVLTTHPHPDHVTASTARAYLSACPRVVSCSPEQGALGGDRSIGLDVSFGATERTTVGNIRLSAMGLHHVSTDPGASSLPHLGYVLHLGPWDVVHLGDSAGTSANVEIVERSLTTRRVLLLVPYWFLDDDTSRAWLESFGPGIGVVLLHVDPWRRARVVDRVRGLGGSIPGLVLPDPHTDVIGEWMPFTDG